MVGAVVVRVQPVVGRRELLPRALRADGPGLALLLLAPAHAHAHRIHAHANASVD